MKRLALALLVACARPHAPPPTRPRPAPAVVPTEPEPLVLAPLEIAEMHEHVRVEDALAPTELTASTDACFRANVAMTAPGRAWFEDATGPRGEASAGAGLVPPHGPVCARKGEVLRLRVEARAARAVVWTSP